MEEDASEWGGLHEPHPSTNSCRAESRQEGRIPFPLADLCTASQDFFKEENCWRASQPAPQHGGT